MQKMAVSVIALLALAGCTSSSPEIETTSEAEESVKSDPMLFCGELGENLNDYASFLADIATADVNLSVYKIQLSRMETLEGLVPSEAKAMLAQYADPVYQIKSVVDAGGGDISFNTDGYKEASTGLIQYCIDAGYSAG